MNDKEIENVVHTFHPDREHPHELTSPIQDSIEFKCKVNGITPTPAGEEHYSEVYTIDTHWCSSRVRPIILFCIIYG